MVFTAALRVRLIVVTTLFPDLGSFSVPAIAATATVARGRRGRRGGIGGQRRWK